MGICAHALPRVPGPARRRWRGVGSRLCWEREGVLWSLRGVDGGRFWWHANCICILWFDDGVESEFAQEMEPERSIRKVASLPPPFCPSFK